MDEKPRRKCKFEIHPLRNGLSESQKHSLLGLHSENSIHLCTGEY